MDLFEYRRQEDTASRAPLADRMRPRTLDDFAGQGHIVGPGRLLRRSIEADQLSSVIFYGPPGTGKTTLARIIANTTQAHFVALNAVLAGVKDIREAVAGATERRGMYAQRTILFIDEVHRFNKAQQDALLPWVENGTVVLIGATTENPYFEVNKALVSRSRIFQLRPLTPADLRAVAQAAINDPERGYGRLDVTVTDEALDHLIDVSGGDARAVLNALELAVETTAAETIPDDTTHAGPDATTHAGSTPVQATPTDITPVGTAKAKATAAKTDPIGNTATESTSVEPISVPVTTAPPRRRVVVDLAVAEESIQRRAVLYDKEGDAHYDTVSAFIKSLRGSDPDAALYWLARMVYAGEAPRFIFRRMLILAAEDVGLADPNAVRVVTACAEAFEYVGLPEGQFHLAEAALYLATAPKSNTALAYFDALRAVERERADDVPTHLKDGNRDQEGFGHGAGYLYPHAYRDHWVAQQYLPDALQGRLFYQPTDQGYEADIRLATIRRREAQLAAMMESEAGGPGEILTFTGPAVGKNRDRWLARSVSGAGLRLAALRDRVLDAAGLTRHSLVLDLAARTGLLTWEALRRVPEGGVWSVAADAAAANALQAGSSALPELDLPTVLVGAVPELVELLELRGEADVRFDAVVGRNAVGTLAPAERAAMLATVAGLMAAGGRLSLAENVLSMAPMPSALLEPAGGPSPGSAALVLNAELVNRIQAAEAAFRAEDPRLAWQPDDLAAELRAAGMEDAVVAAVAEPGELLLTGSLMARWFGDAEGEGRYAKALSDFLKPKEIAAVRAHFAARVGGPPVPWVTTVCYISARR